MDAPAEGETVPDASFPETASSTLTAISSTLHGRTRNCKGHPGTGTSEPRENRARRRWFAAITRDRAFLVARAKASILSRPRVPAAPHPRRPSGTLGLKDSY